LGKRNLIFPRAFWVPHLDAALGVQDLEPLARLIPRLAGDLGQDLLAGDARRHVPVGVEDDLDHPAGEHGRLGGGLAGHDLHRQHGPAPLHHVQVEAADVHHDVAVARVAEIARQPAPAVEVDLDLPDPLPGRHVEGHEGSLAQLAVGIEAVAVLEFDQSGLEGGVEEVAVLLR
jgi:hypothetical protein